MTTGYTQAELDNLQRIMEERAPALSTPEDLKSAPHVLSATWAGSYTGVLLNLQFQAGQSMLFHLNCVVASELMFGISEAMVNCGWEDIAPEDADQQLSLLDTEREGKALNAISLTTGASPDGLLVNLGDGEVGNVRFFLPRSVARQVLLAITTAGETAGWWDKEFTLQPARQPEEIEIVRAANQLMQRYGDRAAMEAGCPSSEQLGLLRE